MSDQPVCGPSIEPLLSWTQSDSRELPIEEAHEAIQAHMQMKDERDALKVENELLKGEVEAWTNREFAARAERDGADKVIVNLKKELQAHRDALKKAKVLLNDGQPPWPNPVFFSHTLENASWRYRRESLIATINTFNL